MKHQFGETADVLPLNDLHAMVRAVLYPWALIGHVHFRLERVFRAVCFYDCMHAYSASPADQTDVSSSRPPAILCVKVVEVTTHKRADGPAAAAGC